MTIQTKILFDECAIGKPQVDQIARFLAVDNPRAPVSLHHLTDYQQSGTWDEVWVPEIASGHWLVISADRGKRGGLKKGQKLHLLLMQYQITHILLGKAIHKQKWPWKIVMILSVWDEIIDIAMRPAWSKHQMEPKTGLRAKLIEKPLYDAEGNPLV